MTTAGKLIFIMAVSDGPAAVSPTHADPSGPWLVSAGGQCRPFPDPRTACSPPLICHTNKLGYVRPAVGDRATPDRETGIIETGTPTCEKEQIDRVQIRQKKREF